MKKITKYVVAEFSVEVKGLQSIDKLGNVTAFDDQDYNVVAEFDTASEAVGYLEKNKSTKYWTYDSSLRGYLVEGASAFEVTSIIGEDGEEVETDINGITTSKMEYEVIKEDGKDVVATFEMYADAVTKAEELEEETGDTYYVDDRA